MRVVEFNSNNWKLSKCSCAWYLKNYICSHIIVLASILKPDSVRYPPESMNIKFGANRKRGRPGKTKPALERQGEGDGENSFSGGSLDDSSENTAEALIRLKIIDELEATANDHTENFDDELVFGPDLVVVVEPAEPAEPVKDVVDPVADVVNVVEQIEPVIVDVEPVRGRGRGRDRGRGRGTLFATEFLDTAAVSGSSGKKKQTD